MQQFSPPKRFEASTKARKVTSLEAMICDLEALAAALSQQYRDRGRT